MYSIITKVSIFLATTLLVGNSYSSSFEQIQSSLDTNWENTISELNLSERKNVYCISNSENTYSSDQNKLIRAGSTSKLYTTLWALEKLGVDYRFETKFYLSDDTLHIQGGSDPYFTKLDFKKLSDYIDEELLIKNVIISEAFNYYGKRSQQQLINALKKDLDVKSATFSNSLPDEAILISSQSIPLITILKIANQNRRNTIFDNLFEFLGGSTAFSKYMNDTFSTTNEEVYFHSGSGIGENYSTCTLTLRVMERLDSFLINEQLNRSDVIRIQNGTAKNSGRLNNFIMSSYAVDFENQTYYAAFYNTAYSENETKIQNAYDQLLPLSLRIKESAPNLDQATFEREFMREYYISEKKEKKKEKSFFKSLIEYIKDQYNHTHKKTYPKASMSSYQITLDEWNNTGAIESFVDFSKVKKEEESLNKQEGVEMIVDFGRLFEKESFAIIDKQKETLSIYNKEGKKIQMIDLTFPGGKGDKRAIVSSPYQRKNHDNNFGAGKYTFVSSNEEYVITVHGDPAIQLKDERGRTEIMISAPSTADNNPYNFNDYNNGNLNVTYMDYIAIEDLLKNGANVFILPNREENFFKVSNSTISFVTNDTTDYFDYNFSQKHNSYREIKAVVTNRRYDNIVSRLFVDALVTEKKNLMKLYNLGNDEYNELFKLAFGILGNESKFGESIKLYIKEKAPLAIAFAKHIKNKDYNNMFSTANNSRGYTQIKTIPKKIKNFYKFTKENLVDPACSAVATLGFLANSLSELKAKAKFHPGITPKTKYNFLHYIYTGRSREITKGTGTPERNIYYRNIRKYGKGLKIFQKM